VIGDGAAIAAALPVMAAGWLYGPWQGILGGVASSGLTFLLIFWIGAPAGISLSFIGRSSLETLFLIILGGFLGIESNLRYKLRAELSSHLKAVRELEQSECSEQDQRNLAEAMIDVAAVLTSVLDLDEVLDKILTSADRMVPHDGANIALLNSEMVIERVARASTSTGRSYNYGPGPDTFTGTPVRELVGLAQMASTGLPLVISDTVNFPGWIVFPESAWVRSFVGAPIIAQGRTVGFINLDSATPAFYQPVHGERLRAFANLAAIAIHNAGLYERAQQQAATDELTGLYNRRGLMSVGQIEVERSLRYVRPLTVLMADVDNFKQVNDRSGYRAGDEVLHMLAKRCRQCLRSIDIAGRYGGDEFVFVLPESSMEGAIKAAERLRASVDAVVFTTTAGPLRISISVGAAMLVPPQNSFDQVLEQAGAALHAAKFAGKNRVAG
jgi:diguanylate cyclase (GGDEF)-like protein